MPTHAEDNPFPSILMVEQDKDALTEDSPAVGSQRLVVDETDHLLYLVDDTDTATLVGAAAGLTDPMTTRGDIIVRNASNVTARLGIGSSGKVLSSDGTDISWQTPSGGSGALVLLEQHAASSSATLDFTTFISSTYDDYLFEGLGLVPATNGDSLYMKVGTGGGPTYAGGTDYYTASPAYNTGNTSSSYRSQSAAQLQLAVTVANGAGYGHCNFSLHLLNPQSTSLMKYVHGTEVHHNGTDVVSEMVGGLWGLTTALTAVQFLFSSGNIASGTIRVYGVAK